MFSNGKQPGGLSLSGHEHKHDEVLMLTRKGKDLLAVATLLAAVAVAGALAIFRIEVSQTPVDFTLNSTPLGYTFSLALFIVPCAAFGIWLWQSPGTAEQRRAFLFTLILLIPLGFILDLFFGRTFLTFPNHEATVGILVPGYDLRSGLRGLFGPGWERVLPIEEFAFYILGFIAMLLAYVWGDQILFHANKVDDNQRTPLVFRGWKETLLFWLAAGTVLFAMAWFIRRSIPSESGRAFPGYFLFLLLVSIIPSLFCSRVAFQFINWRAFALTWLFILGISLFWEGCLGIPYGWWGYEPDQMMGIFLKPLCDLPIEAALVWTLGAWTTIIIYETILTAVHAGRKGRDLFGIPSASDAELHSVKRAYREEGRGCEAPGEPAKKRDSF
jgi:hypothetical protein